MSGWLFFLMGLLFTIPLNIASSYMLGPFQLWLDRNRTQITVRRKRQLQAEYKRVKRYHDDPTQLHIYLLRNILSALLGSSIAFMGTLGFVLGGVIMSITGMLPNSIAPTVSKGVSLPVQLSIILLLLLVLLCVLVLNLVTQQASRAMAIVAKVGSFSKYEAKTLEVLGEGALRESGSTDEAKN